MTDVTPTRPDVDGIIRGDHKRYRDIGKKKARKDLEKYMTDDSFVGRQGDKKVKVPIPVINLPRVRFGPNDKDGDGSGGKGYGLGHGVSGKPGDVLRPGSYPGSGQGGRGAGQDHAEHGVQQFELTRDELAQLLGEQLQLPNMTRKHSGEMEVVGHKYSGRTNVGPDVMLIQKDTLLEALVRTIAEDEYDEDDPVIVPIKDDFRYRTIKPITRPTSKAVTFFLRDVSGSMGIQQRAPLSFAAAYWLNLWIEYCYGGRYEPVYVLHDHSAWEATKDEFMTAGVAGGTSMKSAIELVKEIIKTKYPPNEWNIYIFHFGDGDSWDIKGYLQTLIQIMPDIAMFGYVQVAPVYKGDFYDVVTAWSKSAAAKKLSAAIHNENMVRTTTLETYEDMPKAIKALLS